MSTSLQEKKEALRDLAAFTKGPVTIAREALCEQIAREEAEEAAKKPTLGDLRQAANNYEFTDEDTERVDRILAAVERLAPDLKTQANVGGTYVVSQGPFTDFANAIAQEVRL